MINPRLADCWMSSFEAAKRGFIDPAQSYETLAPALIVLLDGAANRARELHFAEAEVREALFAVVAWIDEAAMSGEWPGAAEWRRAPLQRHYFSTSRAGVEFFQRLEALPEAAGGAREVFGLALLGGFQGRYATRPGGELMQYRRLCLERIILDRQMVPLDATSHLFEQPEAQLPTRLRLVRRGLPGISLLLLIGVPLILLTVLYISFDLSLGRQVSQLLEMR
ncbi:DotU family type IV/VI secretion system protein [Pseudomonas sp. TNT11]|uniref:DotU family type IV/VI secretion system protein n=1 Tax=Pseudomonas emilianonis TaxID=2915812 RepID=A0ABT0EEM0_9PSED|nr:DotU family type IV/VI secretion system protein [Pseudomonas emilianonis]MCK1784150.1 DotU family type IV/VI secretion system protein [Pseudomonas emilianonis]